MPSGVADLTERHLQLLEHAEETVDTAEVAAHHTCRVSDLLGIEAVGDPVMARKSRSQIIRKALLRVLADQPEADVRQRHGCGDEPHCGRKQEGGNEDRIRHEAFAESRQAARGGSGPSG